MLQQLRCQVGPNCPLLLWEAVQDQQVDLAQDPFKLRLLPWVLEHVKFCVHLLRQRSPTFLAPGASFMEDNFSTDWGWVGGWVQVVMQVMGSGR